MKTITFTNEEWERIRAWLKMINDESFLHRLVELLAEKFYESDNAE